jgi:hypothetical protein
MAMVTPPAMIFNPKAILSSKKADGMVVNLF